MEYRSATSSDVPTIVKMLADDPLGATRENLTDPLPQSYFDAFAAIESDPNNVLLVAEQDRALVGFLQLTFIPSLTYQGGLRATIEGVRVHSRERGQGVGASLVKHAIDLARRRGGRLVQLTTYKKRPDALRFYEGLGFVASHEGMKLRLES